MARRATIAALALTLSALTWGCGGSNGTRRQAASTAAPTTSATAPIGSGGGGGSAPVVSAIGFRDLARGTHTGFRTAPAGASAQVVAGDDAAWASLWADHQRGTLPPAPRPAVDFAAERVVALFLGDRPSSGFGVEVVSVAEIASGAAVEVSYVTTRPTGAAASVVTSPFHVVAVNRAVATFTFVDVTPAPTSTPVTDLHGELVWAPTHAGGRTLAFLADGQPAPREVVDPSALARAGARVGTSLVVTGDLPANPGGLTALAESLTIARFELDTVQTTGRLEAGAAGAVALRSVENQVYELTGPLAAALSARPLDRPLRVTGRIDPNHASTTAPGLVVTSWRETVELELRVAGGLTGLDERYAIDDLPGSGAWRYGWSLVIRPGDGKQGRGRLEAAERADLQTLVTAANLRQQPTVFRPPFPIFDVPTTTLRLADRDGEVSIRIEFGSQLPAELDALLRRLQALRGAATSFRALDGGSYSGVSQEQVIVARDAAQLQALWTQHRGGGAGTAPPTVDFTKELVIGAFFGRKPSGGYGISVASVERIGADLYVRTERRSPAPGQPVTLALTSPFQIVVVDLQGATGELWVDGVRR